MVLVLHIAVAFALFVTSVFLLISFDHKVDRKRQFALAFGTYGVNAEFLEVLYNLRRWAVLGLENIDGSIVGRMMGAT